MFYTRSRRNFSSGSAPKQISTPQHQQIASVWLPPLCAAAKPTHGKDINFYATSLVLPTNVHKRIIKQKHFPIIVITINLAYRTMYSAWDSGCALFAHFWRPTNSTHIFKAMRQDPMINCSHTLPFQPFNGDAGYKLSGNKHSGKMQSPDGQSGLKYENETSRSARMIIFCWNFKLLLARCVEITFIAQQTFCKWYPNFG